MRSNRSPRCLGSGQVGFEPGVRLLRRPGRSGERSVTCDSDSPTVSARAHRGPAVPGAVRTQRGPASLRNGGRPIRSHRPAISALAIQLALIVPLKAPAMQAQVAANPVEPVAEAGRVAPRWPQAHVQTLACCQGLGNLRTRTPPTMAKTAPTTSVQIPAPTGAAISSDSCRTSSMRCWTLR
jgi:hypothetical protein